MGAPQFDSNGSYSIQDALTQLQGINGGIPLTDAQKTSLAQQVLGHAVDANDPTPLTGAQMAQAASIVEGYGNAKPDFLSPPSANTPGGPNQIAPQSSWWDQNSPTFQQSGPYTVPQWTGSFTPPPVPTNLQNQYALPTEAEAEAAPGYKFASDQGQQAIERAAAAKGTIDNPGTQQGLAEFNQNLATTNYGNVVSQGLAARQQNVSDYNNSFTQAFQQYAQKYGEFVNQSGMGLTGYQTNVNTQRNSQNDYWTELLGLSGQGLTANGQIAGA